MIAKKPTIVVIYIGINDVWHGEKDPARGTLPETFKTGLTDVIGKCQEAGRASGALHAERDRRKDRRREQRSTSKLDEYSDISRDVAKEMKLPLCDLRKAFVDYLKENNKDNKDKGILTGDRVHLNDAGNQFVADTMLQVINK